MPRTLLSLRTPAIALCVALSACLGDDPVAPRIEDTQFASSLGVDLAASTQTPTGLYYRDIEVGDGPLANFASRVTVGYSARLANGTLVDPGEEPLSFTIGGGEYIPGFEEGAMGMRVGGVRQLIIPPRLGYGNVRNGPIPANSILVFTIELTSVGSGN